MKIPPSQLRGRLLAFAAVLGFAAIGDAQVNEIRIERDATGIYNGRAFGAKYFVTYDNSSFTHQGDVPPVNARARVPVKDGKLSSSFRDSQLPGNDRAVAKGAERRSDVKRGGKLILVRAVGTLNLSEEPRKGIWKGGQLTGNLKDRGAKWAAAAAAAAYQRNQSDVNFPPDHTKRVRGMRLTGRG